MNSKSFIVIQGWMIKYFDLDTKELILFALIFGFTQDGKTIFNGSRKYISEMLNCSVNTSSKLLKELEKKELIIKNSKTISGVIFNSYTLNFNSINKVFKKNNECENSFFKNGNSSQIDWND